MGSRELPSGWIALLTGLFFVATTEEAHAYLDPGTGPYLLQIALGTALAAIFIIKGYWMRIKGFLLRVLGKAKGYWVRIKGFLLRVLGKAQDETQG